MTQESVAYFDNAATSWPKPNEVYDFADSFYRSSGANMGRGQYRMSSKASRILEEDRELILDLFHCPGKQVVFTPSPTIALNCIILGSGLSAGDVVYITPFEHNSVLRPLRALEESDGIIVRQIPFGRESLQIDYQSLNSMFTKDPPKMLIATHVSNVCGLIVPIESLCKAAKAYQATTVLDMSQSAGLIDTDLASSDVDFAVFASHKTLLGPFGLSGFVAKTSAELDPVLFGGNGVDSLNLGMAKNLRLQTEIGSQNTYAAAGLNAALKWVIPRCHSNELSLTDQNNRKQLLEVLGSYECIHLHGLSHAVNEVGIVSASLDGFSSEEFGKILDERNVATRAGLHCAPLAHQFFGTAPGGTVRFSVGAFTSADDFATLNHALAEIESAV